MSINSWVFDVSSLMVLIGEAEESRFRSSRASLVEMLVAAPVAGIQSYLKTYDAVSPLSRLEYFSPYGCKTAPLRNAKLDSAIKHLRLLDEGKYATYEIKDNSGVPGPIAHRSKYKYSLPLWLVLTWIYFGGLIAFWHFAPFGVLPPGTWIGITNISALTGWSIFIRIIEHFMIRDLENKARAKSSPQDATAPDGVIFLGKRNSGLVIRGNRQAVKLWTSSRLEYDEGDTFQIPNRYLQIFIRAGTLLVLLLVFITVPNGSTTDQLVFVLLNILGQLNVFLGIALNSRSCLDELEPERVIDGKKNQVEFRTQIYGYLIRYFLERQGVDPKWVEKAAMLPRTAIWDIWKERVKTDPEDPKDLYDEIKEEEDNKIAPHP